MAFDVRAVDLGGLNSLTKYPSIPTYHSLDPSNGNLLDDRVGFTAPVIGTEKIDGTNARIISLPDGSYLLGSREELLYAKGDLWRQGHRRQQAVHRPTTDRPPALRRRRAD